MVYICFYLQQRINSELCTSRKVSCPVQFGALSCFVHTFRYSFLHKFFMSMSLVLDLHWAFVMLSVFDSFVCSHNITSLVSVVFFVQMPRTRARKRGQCF